MWTGRYWRSCAKLRHSIQAPCAPIGPVVIPEFGFALGASQRTVRLQRLQEVEQRLVDRLRLLLLDPVAAIGNDDRATQIIDHFIRA